MEIKIECPRCQSYTSLSADKAGQYVSCASCGGKVWVPKQAGRPSKAASKAAATSQQAAVATATGRTTAAKSAPVHPPAGGAASQPPTSHPARPTRDAGAANRRGSGSSVRQSATPPPPPPGAPPAMPTSGAPAVQTPPPGAPASSTPPARPKRQVARFITSDVAQSSLALAKDGKLPELHLDEGQEKPRQVRQKSDGPPWLLIGLAAVSLALSTIVMMVPGPGAPRQSSGVDEARARVADYYGGEAADDQETNPPALQPYQVHLREAELARSRGDTAAEREHYLRVIAMLRDESLDDTRGLTGTRYNSDSARSTLRTDEDLQHQISIILRSLR